MKNHAKYDTIADYYVDFLDGNDVVDLASQALIERVGNSAQQTLCDVGCGIGIMVAHFANEGADVVGVDLSEAMLDKARQRYPTLTFIHDDAQTLSQLDDNHFDIVTSNLAITDIPDLHAIYAAVKRVLRDDGRFIFTLTHPCFQAPESFLITDEDDGFEGRHVSRYAEEGYWLSDNREGIRGMVGAHHRTLSTYINGLLAQGYTIRHIAEPTLDSAEDYETAYQKSFTEIPPVLLIEASL